MEIAAKVASIAKNVRKHLFKHVSDPPKAMDVKLTKLVYPHKSDPPMVDARKVALKATKTLDEHHSDPPEEASKNEVKRYSNLTNPCFALAMDQRCYPFLVPWTETEWSFKLWMGGNCYYTPRRLYHRWKIKYWCS